MAAFKSLLYREFRLCRKDNIIRTLLIIVFTALMWTAVFVAKEEAEVLSFVSIKAVENSNTVCLVCLLLSSVCIIACFGLDNVFKSDLCSGWLKYSYTLPVTPLMRAAVRIVRLYITTTAGVVFNIINIAGFCAFTGNPFGTGYLVLQTAIIDLALFIMLIMDFFVFSARDTDTFKKNQTYAGLATTGVICAAVVLFFKINGISFSDISVDNSFSIPVLLVSKMSQRGVFIILLLIMLFLTAADMAAAAYKLRSAEISSAAAKKGGNPSESAGDDLKRIASNVCSEAAYQKPDKTNGFNISNVCSEAAYQMPDKTGSFNISNVRSEAAYQKPDKADSFIIRGFLYKELAQNKVLIAFIVALPLGLFLLSFPMSVVMLRISEMASKGIFEFAMGNVMRSYMLVFGAFVASCILPSVFQGDDKKIWAYFTVSIPGGVREFMYCKYVLVFAMNGLYMIACYFTDTLSATLRYAVTGSEAQGMISGFIAVFYIMLFLCAFDIPFSVRYGAKRGSIIKMALLSFFMAVLGICFVLLPENIQQNILGLFADIFSGMADGTVMLAAAACPFISLAAYILSYKISCRIFLKGVNEYDK